MPDSKRSRTAVFGPRSLRAPSSSPRSRSGRACAAIALRASLRRDPGRRLLWVTLAALIAAPATVSLLKHAAARHCPWDVERYGGYAPQLRWFDRIPEGLRAGRCFPAGHASAGFALLSLYFLARRRSRRAGRFVWLAAFALGLAMGGVQMMRGAHFLSHVLWSGWVCWAAIVAVQALFARAPPIRGAGEASARPDVSADMPG